MVVVGVTLVWAAIAIVGLWIYRQTTASNQTYARFADAVDSARPRPTDRGVKRDGTPANASAESGTDVSEALSASGARRLSRPWRLLPWGVAAGVALTISLITTWPIQYVLAIGSVVAMLASQLEAMLAARQVAKLENQLADAIDIMVGALGAGAAVGPAIDSATAEIESPLLPYLEELSGRIRLGDDPVEVFRSFADRIPLETFLLFSSALAVHWEVGGRLAPTLASVGRTIRDRIDINRRIQSNIAQSQFSTFAIIGLIYLIALIVWRNGPESMKEFVGTSVGSWFVAGSIMLQAVGILWMNWISKPKF